jgi:hypothetical protein
MSSHAPEQALLLGPGNGLVGVITPALPPREGESAAPAELPFVVILNAGIIHRVGPNRLHVSLARALSAQGLSVLRVDLSGLGDSLLREDGLAPLDAALADIRDILDSLQATRGVRRVLLMGLCSGADHSVIYAASDPRVVGVVLLDPSIPRTRAYYVTHYARRLLRLRSWVNVVLGRHPLWRSLLRGRRATAAVTGDAASGGAGAGDMAAARPAVTLEHPEVRSYLEKAYGGALAHGVQFLTVLTSDRERQHNYRRQLLDAFPSLDFSGRLLIEYFKRCDHTFSTLASQEKLVALVLKWVGATRFRAD